MGNIIIRDVDDIAKRNAHMAAAANGRSLQAELKALIERTYARADSERAARIRAMSSKEFVEHMVATAAGADLELPKRTVNSDREIFGAD
jgi:antitoxin FitA